MTPEDFKLQMDFLAEQKRKGVTTIDPDKAKRLERKGWRTWYAEIFGHDFVDAFGEGHHAEALEWHWNSRVAYINGQSPEHLAYFPIWPRGNGKTTLLRALIIADACLSHTAGIGSYALIVGGTKRKAKGSAVTISQMLTLPKIKEYYPALSRVQKTDAGQSQGWTADFIYTEGNAVFNFIGLDEGVAGTNVADIRPTLIAPDDIDDREDSPVISENRFQTFTRAVLPTRQHNTLVFFAQNLISRYSTMYRIYKQQARVLTNRKPTEPIPAVRNLVTEERTVDGIIKDIVVAGQPTWKIWTLERVQNEIDTYGLEAFKRECQHEVEQSKEGLILHNYDDDVHVISLSEFSAVFGKDAWKHWYKVPFNDWSRTKTEKHSNVAGYFAISSANTPYPGLTFCIPFSFPPNQMPEDVAQRFLSELTPYAYGSVTWRELIQDNFQRASAGQHFNTFEEQLAYQRSYLKNAIRQYSSSTLSKYNVRAGAMSHSEDKVRENYNEIFGFGFQPSNPGANDSIEDIIRALQVDYKADHLFREQKGYTRTYILAPDDTSKEPKYVKGNVVYPPVPFPDVTDPKNIHDSDLIRYQFSNWRYVDPKLTELGESIDRPLKINDDFGQGWQMVYFKKLLSNIELSKVEIFEEQMNAQGLNKTEILEIENEQDKIGLLQLRLIEERKFANQQNKARAGGLPWRR